jgi:basic membrane lipoprotein Med (substrate-binding protein (PBP1-ABC) superfamily)
MRVPVLTIALLLAGCFIAGGRIASAQARAAAGWGDLNPKQRYQSLQNYWHHQQLPQERQREIEQRYERWRSMSPDERARVRQNYERFKKLPPDERERFQRKYDKWRQQGEVPR